MLLYKEGIVDSLPQSLLEGQRLVLTPHQIQQLQQLSGAAGEGGGGLTLTLQHGQGQQLLVTQQPQLQQLYPELLAGHTHSILHHHVRQASIIQQVGQTSIHHQQMGMGVGAQVKPGSPFGSRSLTPSPSPQQRVVTPQPLHQVMTSSPQVLQIFQQATRNTMTGTGMNTIKSKPPPQILPKPPGSGGVAVGAAKVNVPQPASSPQISMPTQQQTILLNQMIPSGPMLLQQQSSGVQLFLRSPPPSTPGKPGAVMLSNGSLAHPGTVLLQGRHQPQPQYVRLVSGQTLQLQQIQTSSGPAIIAVPTSVATPTPPTPPPSVPQPMASPNHIKKKKKKKEKEEPRLDLANLMKLSGIEDEDMAPATVAQQTQTPPQPSPTPPTQAPTAPHLHPPAPMQLAPPPPASPKQPSHLVAQLQTPSQCPSQSLRVSMADDGRMMLVQGQPHVSVSGGGAVTPSIAAAAQSQLAQLLATHGDSILQNNSCLSGAASKDSAALLQSLQTAVLSWAANTDSHMVMKGGGVAIAGTPHVMLRRPNNTPTSVVVANPLMEPANGMRIVTEPRIQVVPCDQGRMQIVNSLSECSQQQNRVQIVNSMSEQQNRVQIVNSLSEQQNRVQIVNSLSEQQNRVQIVTSVPHSQTVSFNDHNRFHTIVSRAPTSSSMSVEHQNRLHIVSSVPTSTTMSLTEQQNRTVQIVSGSQMSTGVSLTDQQSRVQIVSGVPNTNSLSLTEQQNRVQIVSGVPNSTLTEQQNRVQIVSGIPHSNAMTLSEQNRVQIVSGVSNPSMSLSEQNRVQIVSAVPHSNAMSLEQQNRVQIVSGVHSSSAMSMTEQQNRVQIVSGITNKAMSLTEQQNRVQIISGVPSANSMSLTEQQNRVQIVSGMENSNSLSLEQQNRVQIVSGMQSGGMSLADQQNRVHIVSGLANSSLSCEQNRVQIVSGVSNSAGIQLSEPPSNRVHVVSASTNTTEQPSRVQIVSGIPNRTATSISDRIQLVQNEQNRVQIASSMPSLSFSDHQNRVHIVSGTSNSTPVISEQNRVQIVTGVPNNILSLSEQQSRVQILSNSSHSSAISLAPEQQRLQLVTGLNSEPTLEIVTSTANSEHVRVSSSSGPPINEHQRLQVVTTVPNSCANERLHIVSSLSMNDRLRVPNSAIEPPRMQSSGMQTVDMGTKMPQFQPKQSSRPVYQPTVISPRGSGAPVVSPQSPRGGGTNSKSPVAFPSLSPQQNHQQSPQQSPKPSFSNRPNLIVVTQPSPSYQPQTPTSQDNSHENHNHYPHFASKSTTTSHHEGANHPSVITSLASCQSTTAITKPLQAVTRQPARPPVTTPTTTSYHNSFLDSIAQSHPSLVINKPSAPIASKALKPKKLPKKSAVVKPMMHEVQTTTATCEKDPEPPSLVPIGDSHSPNVVQRVQTIQLTPQKQQLLKGVQSQITVLNAKKIRTPAENAALQRLFIEQQKILFSGKLIPTIPGQHAQGITFQVSTPMRVLPTPTSSPRQPLPPAPALPVPHPIPHPLPQHHASALASTPATPAPAPAPAPILPPPPQHHPPPPPPPAPAVTCSKATSPIHIQVGTQTQTSCEPSPSPPTISCAKRAVLIDQQQRADRQGASMPDTSTPFASTSDAVKRLVRYHCMDEPVFTESDLHKADEIFEATARHLLDKKGQMLNKYKYLLMMESMRQVQTSELIQLGRAFITDESARLEAAKIEANAPSVKREREDKVVKKEHEEHHRESGSHDRHSHGHGHERERGVKREREDGDEATGGKKHCADDEEINAQVQNAIDSILNLGNNRSDPAIDEAVRSILSS